MHVITGINRGMKLLPPGKHDRTRPTEDKTKESVFDVLQTIQKDAVVLDLFAGTGQIGIEFLSRGAGRVVFCEKSRSMGAILRENIRKTGHEEESTVFLCDYRRALADCDTRFDYVYLDPPFGFHMEEKAIALLRRLNRMKKGGLIIVESGLKRGETEPEETEMYGFRLVFQRAYRSQLIRMFKEEV